MENKKLTPQIAAMYLGQKSTIAILKNTRDFSIGETWSAILKLTHIEWLEDGRISAKPHLRQLDSITEKEAREIYTLLYPDIDKGYDNCLEDWWYEIDEGYCRNMVRLIGNPKVWLYLLSKGFDLFGLIEAGEAIDINAK